MHTPLVWTGLCMTSDAAWDTKAHFGSGRAPACDPMSNSPPARECGCRKLLFCPGTAQKAEGPAHIAPLRAALTCLVLSKVGTSE